MVMLLLLMLMLHVTMLMTDAGVHGIPGTHDLCLRPMRENIQDTEGLDAPIIGLSFPFVLLVRVLHRHHLQTFQRFEIVVGSTSSGRSTATGPAVHIVLLFVVILLVIMDARHRIVTVAHLAAGPAIRHPVVTVSGVVSLLIVSERIPTRVGSPGAQAIGVILPGGGQLVFCIGGHHDQR